MRDAPPVETLTIAVAVDDARLVERVTAALDGVVGVRLVPAGERADVVLTAANPVSIESEAVLTPREVEVLMLLAEGSSNKAIARRLGISVHTAKFHVGSLIDKLDATGRTDAVAHAARLGVIDL